MSGPYPPRRRSPRGPMRRDVALGPSPLDLMVERFQYRWETDGQYRTRISTVAGAALLLFLCTLATVFSLVASTAFGFGGSGGSGGGGLSPGSSGPGQVFGAPTFPTGTAPPWTPQDVPNAGPAPNSQTPPPGPTKQPTATPAQFETPTPGGPLPTTCNGNSGKDTWALSPCPQVAGQSGTLSISAPGYQGAILNIALSFGNCPPGQNCAFLGTPDQGYHLDANATATIQYTIPAAAAHNTAPISGYVNVNGGPRIDILAAPVQ